MLRSASLHATLCAILLAGLGASCTSSDGGLSAQDLADRLSNALSFEDGDREDGAPPDGADGADVAGILAVDVPSQVFGGQGFLVVLEVTAPSEAAARAARIGIDGFDTRHYRNQVEFARWDPVAGRGTLVMTARLLDDGELHNHSFFLKAGLENETGKLGRYKDFTINIKGACVASGELCDQLDNDCDFSIDNGFDDLLTECKAGDPNSVCEARGLLRCSADGTTLECDADITEKDGDACEDGDWCTVNETCTNGSCAGGAARDCTAQDDACNTGTCDEATDACVKTPKADTVTCNDDSWCTINDHCDGAGTCTGDARDCSAQADACHPGACDETNEQCVPGDPYLDNTSCGQSGEICLGGVCDTHDCPTASEKQCSADDGAVETCQANGQGFRKWVVTEDCSTLDDDCNAGACQPVSFSCAPEPLPNTTPCTDTEHCTVNEHCDGAGHCTGDTRDCSSVGDPCHPGTCNEGTDACEVGAQLVDNASCGASGEICLSGICDTHDCPTVDGLGCSASGDQIEVCKLNGDGFRKWTLQAICTGETALCDPVSFTCVECYQNGNCDTVAGEICLNNLCGTHDCPVVDGQQCNTAGDAVESCQLDGESFRKWVVTETCGGAAAVCHTTLLTCVACQGDADCNQAGGEVCLNNACGTHDCDTLTEQQCSASGGAVETCQQDADGFRKWAETEACSGTTPVCDGSTYTCVGCLQPTDCDGQSAGDTCESKTCVCGAGGSACAGVTPACREADSTCVECASNSDCSGYDVCHADNRCGDLFPPMRGDFLTGITMTEVFAGKFDADDLPDVLVSEGASAMHLYRNAGLNTFAAAPLALPMITSPVNTEVADLTGDGVLDVVQSDDGRIAVYRNNGTGQLTDPVSAGDVYSLASTSFDGPLAIADFDGVNGLDIVTGDFRTGEGGYCMRVFLNNGDGTAFVDYDCPTLSLSPVGKIAALDWDGDGDVDVAYLDNASSPYPLQFMANDGSANFTGAGMLSPLGVPRGLVSAQLNADSAPDLAFVRDYLDTHVVEICLNETAQGAPAAPSFTCTPVSIVPHENPGHPEPFDLDGDLDIDLAVPTWTGDGIIVLENNGLGSFSINEIYAVPSVPNPSPEPSPIAAVDIDGNGTQDLITVTEDPKDHILLYENLGDGTLGAPRNRANRTMELYLARGNLDLDNDGDADLVLSSWREDKVIAYKNDGAGNLTEAWETTVGDQPNRMTLASLDGDAFPELIVHNANVDTLSVCTNNAGTGFSFCQTLTPAAGYDGSVAPLVGDLSGNGNPDILAVASTCTLYEGDGFGGLAEYHTFANDGYIDGAALGHMNDDQLLDVVLGHDNSSTNDISVWLNPGDGKFDPLTDGVVYTVTPDLASAHIALIDFNQDGNLDVAMGFWDTDEVWLVRNLGDGVLDTTSPLKMQVGSQGCLDPHEMITADLDLDGDDDLAVTCYGTDAVALLRQNPGNMTPFPYLLATGSEPATIAVGDFDKNGAPDLAVGNYITENVSITLNLMSVP